MQEDIWTKCHLLSEVCQLLLVLLLVCACTCMCKCLWDTCSSLQVHMYVWVSMGCMLIITGAHIHVCPWMWRWESDIRGFSSTAPHLFWDNVSHWAWCLLIWLDWLAHELHGVTVSTATTTVPKSQECITKASFFYGHWGPKLRSWHLCLCLTYRAVWLLYSYFLLCGQCWHHTWARLTCINSWRHQVVYVCVHTPMNRCACTHRLFYLQKLALSPFGAPEVSNLTLAPSLPPMILLHNLLYKICGLLKHSLSVGVLIITFYLFEEIVKVVLFWAFYFKEEMNFKSLVRWKFGVYI